MSRNTTQRRLVFEAVRHLDGHPTAEQICTFVAAQVETISRGTVYRNLNYLVESGEIVRLSISGDPDRYDSDLSPHYHMKCRCCGGIFHVKMPYDTEICNRAMDFCDMQVESYSLIFFGVCSDCLDE